MKIDLLEGVAVRCRYDSDSLVAILWFPEIVVLCDVLLSWFDAVLCFVLSLLCRGHSCSTWLDNNSAGRTGLTRGKLDVGNTTSVTVGV